MHSLEKLTAKHEYCESLITLGVVPVAFLWYLCTGADVWDVQAGSWKYTPGVMIPAWTKAELDIMIGNAFPKPDLPMSEEIWRTIRSPHIFTLKYPDKEREFSSGADASAEALVYLIENKVVTIDTLNKRYLDHFKLNTP